MIYISSSSGSLPTRQVQMFDVAIPLVVELVLSAFYILPPSSSPASFGLVFLLIFFLAFSLRLQFLTVILLLECVRSTSFVWFLLYEGSFLSNRFQYFFICLMFCPADFSKSTFQKPQVFLYLLSSLSMFLLHTAPHSISVSLSSVSSMFCLLFLSKVLSSLRMLLFLLLFFF